MKKKHINLLYPQWQGGGKNKATYEGGLDLKSSYLKNHDFFEIDISTDEDETVFNNIWAYDTIVKQMTEVKTLLDTHIPDTLFTMGGGDDIEILPMSYINNKNNGDMTVVFFDAHGDINTPESSPSKNFHGMPLRTLLGESDPKILEMMYSTLLPQQLVMIGTRDCDDAESEYIAERQITVIPSEAVNENVSSVINAVKGKGKEKIYIHVDIDVLDPKEFEYQPVPAPDGLFTATFSSLLDELDRDFQVVGLCVLGYTSMEGKRIPIIQKIIDIGTGIQGNFPTDDDRNTFR